MRYFQFGLLAFTGFFFVGQAPAQATDYPYCLTYVQGWSGTIEQCDYSTMAQCWASAGGLSGTCGPNWRLAYRRGVSPDEIESGTTSSKRSRR
ncbi:MAG: DUF3551 domain-containing protein [Afipia sp.]